MKIEKVIKQLESILDHTRSMAASPDADDIWRKDIDALKFAITALRSMQEAGEPLSLEQLREVPHGKIKDSTLQNIANRANEIASPPAHIDRREWISVKERLPDKGKNVIVYATAKYIGGEKTAIDRLEEGENHPIWMYTHGWFEVTHWMPLPEPPEEG